MFSGNWSVAVLLGYSTTVPGSTIGSKFLEFCFLPYYYAQVAENQTKGSACRKGFLLFERVLEDCDLDGEV